jgi:GT2 family glycosyltransferase
MSASEIDGGSRVTAVIVTYNSADVIRDCLESMSQGFDGVAYDVVVVDNASRDNTLDVVRRVMQTARILEAGANLGYAAALNLGIANAALDSAVLVLNADICLERGCIARMLDALRDPRVGMVAPRMIAPDGSLSFSLRRDATVLRTLGALLLGAERAGRYPQLGEVVSATSIYETPSDPDWATGAALLVSRKCLDSVGAWDESFFLYSEETDFTLRARDAGFALRYRPDAVVVHGGGEMSDDPRLWAMVTVNRLELYRRRHSRAQHACYTAAVALYEASRALRGSEVHKAGLLAILRPSTRPREVRRTKVPT